MFKNIAVIGLKGLPSFGGAASVGEAIISELKNEYIFTVYSTSSHTIVSTGNYNGFKQIVFKKIPFKKLNTLYYYIISSLHALIFGKYDLIHLHHRDAAFLIPLLRLKYKVIVTTHNSFVVTDKWKKYNWFFQINERYFLRFANIVTSVSRNEQRKFKKNIKLDVIYIPNGINTNINLNITKTEFNNNYIFFGAGRIIRTKGLHVFLNALQNIKYNGKIIVAGDINQNLKYKAEIMELSKNLDVEFVGLIKDKFSLYKIIKGSKLFVYPSYIEAMSMMLLEGASLKVPIICADIIENKDIFDENEVLFFKTNDFIDLSEKILYAFNNYDEMLKKAELAYRKLENEYNWSKISKEYSNLYKSLLFNH